MIVYKKNITRELVKGTKRIESDNHLKVVILMRNLLEVTLTMSMKLILMLSHLEILLMKVLKKLLSGFNRFLKTN